MLELRIRADKSGDEPAEGEAWPIAAVETVGKLPKAHNWADNRVADGLARGYISFEGLRVDVSSVVVDGRTIAYPRGMVPTGDVLVLHAAGGDSRWKVLEPPGVYLDEEEPAGYRISHEYRTKRVGA